MGWVLFLQIVLLMIVIFLIIHALIEQYFKMRAVTNLTEAELRKKNYLS